MNWQADNLEHVTITEASSLYIQFNMPRFSWMRNDELNACIKLICARQKNICSYHCLGTSLDVNILKIFQEKLQQRCQPVATPCFDIRIYNNSGPLLKLADDMQT